MQRPADPFQYGKRAREGEGVMLDDLRGKAVLVTGASSGIGAATARAFANHGSDVGVHYFRSRDNAEAVAADCRKAGVSAELYQADMRDSAAVAGVVGGFHDRFGRIDVLIANAGDLMGRRTVEEADDAFVLDVFRTNALSVVAACRSAIPLMRAAGGGSIVTLSSIVVRNGGSTGTAFYAATKSYVTSLTRSLAKQHAAEGIRVNAVAPGIIDTPIHARFTPPEVMAGLAASIPMGRLGTAEEVANAMLYFGSDASAYLTGAVIDVNGGAWVG